MFKQYITYLAVGVGVTVATVLLRAVIGGFLPDDTTFQYMGTIVIAYMFGIGLSLYAHKSVTFRWKSRLKWTQIARFIGVHFLGMGINLAGSTFLRQQLLNFELPDEAAKTLAFGAAAMLVSLGTFALKRAFVFV